MKSAIWLLLLLTAAPLWAKPKVDVRVKVNEGIGRDSVRGALSKNGSSNSPADVIFATVYYLNVTVSSDNAEAVAKNDGQWCIRGDDALDVNGEYRGTLDGNNLEIQFPIKNGKTKKLHFDILDHKWRTLSEL
jgi:hypothetical protein